MSTGIPRSSSRISALAMYRSGWKPQGFQYIYIYNYIYISLYIYNYICIILCYVILYYILLLHMYTYLTSKLMVVWWFNLIEYVHVCYLTVRHLIHHLMSPAALRIGRPASGTRATCRCFTTVSINFSFVSRLLWIHSRVKMDHHGLGC